MPNDCAQPKASRKGKEEAQGEEEEEIGSRKRRRLKQTLLVKKLVDMVLFRVLCRFKELERANASN